jgi:hypothetical protein
MVIAPGDPKAEIRMGHSFSRERREVIPFAYSAERL